MASSSKQELNVLGSALEKCSVNPADPVTGYMRDGYCRSIPSDGGKHTIAAVVSDKWLEFSAWRGNDLATPQGSFPGLKDGCRWCLCVSRWKEAFDARGQFGDDVVPKIDLKATHMDALKMVKLEDLKAFALPDTGAAGGRTDL